MPVESPEQLIAVVRRSRLLTNEQFSELEDYVGGSSRTLSPVKLAQWLVHRNWVTVWQAERLLAGVSSFFLGNYKFLHPMAEGAMGVVFKAQHAVMGRVVAIKVLSKARLSHPNAVARFAREVQAVAALDHPNIVTAYDAGQVGKTHYLVMEYIDGIDLSQFADRYRRVPIPWACEFVRQAALGLHHAHQQGMVHRDIKPANILVTWREADQRPLAKVLDLGLALIFNEADEVATNDSDGDETAFILADPQLTQAGTIVGTPDYLAPEQIARNHAIDARSDIFGLGCTLFRLLTGQLPYGGPDLLGKLHARVSPTAPPAVRLRSLLPEAPVELDELLARMLERNPDARPASAWEVAECLAKFASPPAQKWEELQPRSLSDEETGEVGSSQYIADPQLRDFLGKLETEQPPADLVEVTDASTMELPGVRTVDIDSNSSSIRFVTVPRRRGNTGFLVVSFLLVVVLAVALWQVLALTNHQAAAWPGPAERPSFMWASRDPGQSFPQEPAGFRSLSLVPLGAASFLNNYTLAFSGRGVMRAPGAGDMIRTACQHSGQLSVEAWISPLDLELAGPACIVSLASQPHDANFALAQEASGLVLYLRTNLASPPQRVVLARLVDVVPQHVLVTYRSGDLRCFVDGRQVYASTAVRGNFDNWQPAQLSFGSDRPGHEWKGRLQGIALRGWAVSAEEARDIYKMARAWRERL